MGLCAATKEKSQSTKATVLDCQQLIMVQGNPAMEFPPCTLRNAPQLVCFSCQRIAASTLHLHLPLLGFRQHASSPWDAFLCFNQSDFPWQLTSHLTRP